MSQDHVSQSERHWEGLCTAELLGEAEVLHESVGRELAFGRGECSVGLLRILKRRIELANEL